MEPPQGHEVSRVSVVPGGRVQLDLLGPDGQVAISVTMSPAAARGLGEALFKAGSQGL